MSALKTLAVMASLLFPTMALAEHWRYCAPDAPLTNPCKQWLVGPSLGAKTEQSSDIPAYNHAWMRSHGVKPRPHTEVPRYGQAPESATRPFSVQTAEVLVR